MTSKSRIVEELGERALLLPDRISHALIANDRIKYLLTLFQAAARFADHPEEGVPNLRREREAAGVEDHTLDDVVDASRQRGEDYFAIPQATRLRGLVVEQLKEMLAPLRLANGASGAADEYQRRVDAVVATLPAFPSDTVPRSAIADMARARHRECDGVHLLVMDLHKELNRLQAAVSREQIDGATIYDLAEDDRPLVKAFMGGLNSTAQLKFDHPGLGTTATRTDGKLVIQNDIGTTDAHVLVVHVTALTVTLTYTDVHVARARFFQSLFERYGVEWGDSRSRQVVGLEDGETFYQYVGCVTAQNRMELARYLNFLGSRIVFLIDWNRARKRLRNFVRKRDCIAVLKWAADHNYGHRGFLQLGAEGLIYDAIQHTARTPIRFGQRLDQILGREIVVDFLKQVLKITSEGLMEGRSERLIQDEVKAELFDHFESIEQGLLTTAAEHAAIVFELASGVRDALSRITSHSAGRFLEQTARRAVAWERRADEFVVRARGLTEATPNGKMFGRLLTQADDAADSLEEAAFLLTMLAPLPPSATELLTPLQSLAELALQGTQEFVKCLESAAYVRRGGAREDMQDFLEAVDRVVFFEHETDTAERAVTAALVGGAQSCQQLYLLSQIARSMEEAADALSRSVLMLRDHVLTNMMVA